MANKILVLGANGFIGSNLAKHLVAEGYEVFGIGRTTAGFSAIPGLTFRETDINEQAIGQCCPNPDVIINCAGGASVNKSFEQPFLDFQKTVQSLFSGLEFIRKSKRDCLFIQTSSAAVYGNQHGKLSEYSSTEDQVSPYGVYKKACEQICKMYQQQFGLNISILRLFSIYGVGLKKQLLWDACNKIIKGNNGFHGTGEEVRDWLHIDDTCELYSKVIELNKTGLFLVNGGTGNEFQVIQLLQLIYQGLNVEPKPVFSLSSRQGDPDLFIADNSLAESIGWQANINLEYGVLEYTDWFKKNYRDKE